MDRVKALTVLTRAWRSKMLLRDKVTVLTAATLIDLIRRIAVALRITDDHEDLSQEDVWGVHDADLVDEFDLYVKGHDELRPFKEMLFRYSGREPTTKLVREIVWRVATGFEDMLNGTMMAAEIPRNGPPEEFWAGLFIESCGYGPPSRKGKLQLTLRFRLMSGKYAGLYFDQNIVYFVVVRKIAKEIGFPLYKKTHYNELVQCVFEGLVKLEQWGGDRLSPRVSEYRITPRVKTFNMGVRKARKADCHIQGYNWPCYSCSRGYADNSVYCERAVRPDALVRKTCPQCGRSSFFEAEGNSPVCISCQAKPYKLLER